MSYGLKFEGYDGDEFPRHAPIFQDNTSFVALSSAKQRYACAYGHEQEMRDTPTRRYFLIAHRVLYQLYWGTKCNPCVAEYVFRSACNMHMRPLDVSCHCENTKTDESQLVVVLRNNQDKHHPLIDQRAPP